MVGGGCIVSERSDKQGEGRDTAGGDRIRSSPNTVSDDDETPLLSKYWSSIT
jgi:hypothetical protein